MADPGFPAPRDRVPAARTSGVVNSPIDRSAAAVSCASSATGSPPESPTTKRYPTPAIAAPASGATQNSHNCASAQPPTNNAGPVERAGFTDVLVTGMLIR